MSRWATTLVLFVVVFHFAAFVMEALLWMRPAIHEALLPRLNDPLGRVAANAVELHDQALLLKRLFVNQDFYNLFLALAGIAGLLFARRGDLTIGYTLIGYMCLSAIGAGLVLALSTHAFLGASLQALPAAVALAMIVRGRPSTRSSHPPSR